MNIFSNITSPESIYIFLWLLGAFLIGLIVGWYTWGTAKRALEAELADLKAKFETLTNDYNALKLELEATKSAHIELKAEHDWKSQRLHDIETEKGDLHTKIYALKDKLKIESNERLTFATQLDGLNASYNGAKTEAETLLLKVQGLENELEAARKTLNEQQIAYNASTETMTLIESNLATANETITDLNAKIAALENDVKEYKSRVVSLDSTNSALKVAETRIAVLKGNLEGLEEELADCKSVKAALHAATILAEAELPESRAVETEVTVEDAKLAIAMALGSKIGTASADDKDDLTKIKGIGAFIEEKLNNLGIYQFGQIANFDDATVENITNAIEFFPGRIQRDQWVAQAKALISNTDIVSSDVIEVEGAPAISKIDVAQARQEVKNFMLTQFPLVSENDKDDLKIIRGIGPFIEEKLNNLGIYTYEQVSLFTPEMIDTITNAIDFFPGRIERDEWVEQAKALFDAKEE